MGSGKIQGEIMMGFISSYGYVIALIDLLIIFILFYKWKLDDDIFECFFCAFGFVFFFFVIGMILIVIFSIAGVSVSSSNYVLAYLFSIVTLVTFIVGIRQFVLLPLIQVTHRYRKMPKLPKAVVNHRFPYNHLSVLGVDKLKKYVPPASPTMKIVSVNLKGIKTFLGWQGPTEELKRLKLD